MGVQCHHRGLFMVLRHPRRPDWYVIFTIVYIFWILCILCEVDVVLVKAARFNSIIHILFMMLMHIVLSRFLGGRRGGRVCVP